VLIAGTGLVGCGGPVPIYAPTTGGYLGASISPKRQWVAAGDLYGAPAAVDGNLTTAARSDYQYDGAELTIDLNAVCLFQTVVIDHGQQEHGHCRRVAVSTSLDGQAFTEQHQVAGTRRITILSLPKPVLARHVRLRAVRAGKQPWSIAEVFLQ